MPYDFSEERTGIQQSCAALSIIPTNRCLLVSIAEQAMALMRGEQLVESFPISTSKNGPSCRAESFGTPTGLHCIGDKIGHDAAAGMVFKGRQPIGQLFHEVPAEAAAQNLITSRILWLRGLEPGRNSGPGRDSYERYIYIHGTNHEDRIGQPFSGGCVEMYNADVIRLFEMLDRGDLVWIQ
jgi:hypothetical protein